MAGGRRRAAARDGERAPAAGEAGAAFEVVERRAHGRMLLRFTGGVLAGRTVVAFPDDECRDEVERFLSPSQRAERLLLSLLDDEQTRSWRAAGTFTVGTSQGVVELGHLSNLRFWPGSGEPEVRLCVVPHGRGLPLADVWVNLLLMLRDDPAHFFGVANWFRPGEGTWHPPPVPGVTVSPRDGSGAAARCLDLRVGDPHGPARRAASR